MGLEMMESLYNQGPVVGSFEPNGLMSYGGGIYSDWAKKSGPPSGVNGVHPWEKVDHSVLVVGWGEQNGVKYWICKNSWGPHWGESGYFKMRRGMDDLGMESMSHASIPVISQT